MHKPEFEDTLELLQELKTFNDKLKRTIKKLFAVKKSFICLLPFT